MSFSPGTMRRAYVGLLLAAPFAAFAYLDPGTGSLLLYALAGIATSALFALRNLWYAARGALSFGGARIRRERLPDLVFHSEGGKYWNVFLPVIEALEKEGASCAYVSPDPEDPGLRHQGRGFRALRPGGEMATIAWMNAIEAETVVSTTPHLDIYMLRRSKRVGRYVHLFHAPTDICFYEKYAFDRYDCLLTVGDFQERSVRRLETKRGTAPKLLLPTGCSYYDVLLRELPSPEKAKEPVALYAPAWGVRSSALERGEEIILGLARAGFHVIFRPHPQFFVSHREELARIEGALKGQGGLEIDRGRSGLAAMARSDLLVTDLSGILFDYALLFGRPIILAKAEASAGGQEGEDLPAPLWDAAASRELAFGLLPETGEGLGALARAALAAGPAKDGSIERLRRETFSNFGAAGAAAARQLLGLAGVSS